MGVTVDTRQCPPPNDGATVVSVSICADVHLYAMLMTQSMSLQVYRVDVENHTATTMFFPGSFSGENTVGRDPVSSFIRRTLSAAGRARAEATRVAMLVPSSADALPSHRSSPTCTDSDNVAEVHHGALYAYRLGEPDLLRLDWENATSQHITLPAPIVGPVVCTAGGRIEVGVTPGGSRTSLLEVTDGTSALEDGDAFVARLFSPTEAGKEGEEEATKGIGSLVTQNAESFHAFSAFGSLRNLLHSGTDDAAAQGRALGSLDRGCMLSVRLDAHSNGDNDDATRQREREAGRNQYVVFTENLFENIDGVRAPHQCSLGHATVSLC